MPLFAHQPFTHHYEDAHPVLCMAVAGARCGCIMSVNPCIPMSANGVTRAYRMNTDPRDNVQSLVHT